MACDAYLFDLDGTVLDTLPDLVNITNTVLAEWGMPGHTSEEISSYVGNGARMLLVRAAPAGTSDAVIDALLDRWRGAYPELGHKFTQPFEGIPEALDALKRQGAKLGVLSNKFDAATRDVIERFFPGVFDLVRGEGPETPRKPDPAGLIKMMSDLEVVPEKCAYVGDSGSDMTVALRAGCLPVGVTWGYRNEDELRECGARVLIDVPQALVDLQPN